MRFFKNGYNIPVLKFKWGSTNISNLRFKLILTFCGPLGLKNWYK